MSIFQSIRNTFKREIRAAEPSWDALAGNSTASGKPVSARTAESITAVYACVAALSESTACLPLHVYARTEDGNRERDNNHWLAKLLREPNPYQSAMAFREAMTASVLLNGNAYARKETNGSGEVVALHPLDTGRVAVVKLDNGRHRYDYTDDKGQVQPYVQEEVFHLADRTDAGSIVGKSRIAVARETLGVSLALRDVAASGYANGLKAGGFLVPENNLTAPQIDAVQTALGKFGQRENAGKWLMLLKGMKPVPNTAINMEDAQFIASQQFSVEEIARLFRVPPTLIQDLKNGTYTNVIELGSQFVRYSLARWVTLWEAEITRQLLGPIARRRYYAEHAVEGLLRGNSEARAQFYASAITAGWMDVDEVRKLENLPPRITTKT